jgi:hypothetical protein
LLVGDRGFIAPEFGREKTIGVLHQLGKQVDPLEVARVLARIGFYDSLSYDCRWNPFHPRDREMWQGYESCLVGGTM